MLTARKLALLSVAVASVMGSGAFAQAERTSFTAVQSPLSILAPGTSVVNLRGGIQLRDQVVLATLQKTYEDGTVEDTYVVIANNANLSASTFSGPVYGRIWEFADTAEGLAAAQSLQLSQAISSGNWTGLQQKTGADEWTLSLRLQWRDDEGRLFRATSVSSFSPSVPTNAVLEGTVLVSGGP